MNYETSVTLGKILSGISKSLNFANQVIPLYNETKPLFKNAQSIFNLIKGNDKEEKGKSVDLEVKPNVQEAPKEKEVSNNPQFFI